MACRGSILLVGCWRVGQHSTDGKVVDPINSKRTGPTPSKNPWSGLPQVGAHPEPELVHETLCRRFPRQLASARDDYQGASSQVMDKITGTESSVAAKIVSRARSRPGRNAWRS